MRSVILMSMSTLVAGACATDRDVTTEPQAVGATCGNGIYEPTEVCVDTPGPLVLATGEQVHTVLVADVNADGRRDIVAVTSGRAWVRYGSATGFGSTMYLSTAGASYTDIAAADFDGDGDLDLAAVDAGTDRVIVWRNTGAPLFPLWATIAVGAKPVRVLAARLDNDTRPDLVVLSTGAQQAAVLLANGAPFAAPVAYAVGTTEDIALSDCDNDKRIDLLYLNGTGTHTLLRVRRNHGTGALAAPLSSSLPLYDAKYGSLDPFVIASADFNHDGNADAVVSASWSRLAPATGNGDCTFTPAYTAATMNWTWAWVRTRLRLVDWNGDGNLDLGAPHGLLGGVGDEVYSIAYGDGSGRFPSYQMQNFDPDTVVPRDLAFSDVNADGHLDVLVAGDVGVYLQRRIP